MQNVGPNSRFASFILRSSFFILSLLLRALGVSVVNPEFSGLTRWTVDMNDAPSNKPPTSPLPVIACTLDPASLEQRKGMLWKIIGKATERRTTTDGYEFQFDAKSVTLSDLTEVIALERECCPFLCFVLTIEPAGGPLRLQLTGPEGTKEFLASILSHDLRATSRRI
jgi:hypothetical protein